MDSMLESSAYAPGEIIFTSESGSSSLASNDGIGIGVAIGGGVGAHIAIASGTVTGAAWAPILAAAGGGLAASFFVGWGAGTWIGEREIVRDNIAKAIESIFPVGVEIPQFDVRMPTHENDHFSLNVGQELFAFDFYVDAKASEGVFAGSGYQGTSYYGNAWGASSAAFGGRHDDDSTHVIRGGEIGGNVEVVGTASGVPADVMLC